MNAIPAYRMSAEEIREAAIEDRAAELLADKEWLSDFCSEAVYYREACDYTGMDGKAHHAPACHGGKDILAALIAQDFAEAGRLLWAKCEDAAAEQAREES